MCLQDDVLRATQRWKRSGFKNKGPYPHTGRPKEDQMKKNAFTLIELMIVIVIIMLLAGLMSPLLQKSLAKGRMTQAMNNGKQIFMSLFSDQLEKKRTYPVSAGEGGFSTSTAYWKWAVTNRIVDTDFSLFSAYGLETYRGLDPTRFTAAHNAWCITADISSSQRSVTPLLFTRNLDIARLNDPLDNAVTETEPFGKGGVLVVRLGGDAAIYDQAQLAEGFNPAGDANAVLKP